MDKWAIEQSDHYKQVESAIEFLERNFRRQPSLDEIAASVNLSKFHFQRLFKRWAGVTPSQFLGYLTIEYAKGRLRASQSVFNVSQDAGLSGSSRLHDLFVSFEAMTPGTYKQYGKDLDIFYAFLPTPFGECLLATTERGICALRFPGEQGQEGGVIELQKEWPLASFTEDQEKVWPIVRKLFSPNQVDDVRKFHLILRGTNFQIQVWQALLAIPPGVMVAYQDVASSMASPTAARAVAHAVARNPISFIIPCHRVIRKAGNIHKYRWGSARKKAMLGWEASQLEGEIPQA
jgi:AraC family transcriptional regulator, regulatory protein of adaptative response / methylated-DNA-[protein]-cysteine methyltransferase